ncbi:unnamed protein product [Chrysoparadoxa australica]
MNFTGFYKILKKHDKGLPHSPPCKAFYMSRLHSQSWVRGDYSDVLVTLSRVHGQLRGDEEVENRGAEASQNYVRSTKKYWVKVEDVSKVKYALLQHLPVFLQDTMGGETDSQLVNSVYLDNSQLELYHGRLDKTPGAIALRLRWYGVDGPSTVFVERKTHRESWTGDVSVKERFTIRQDQVMDFLDGKYNIDAEEANLRAKGNSEETIREWRSLAVECLQAITSKQLQPTMRSQYMRTAFQIPFDATVRVSLDTNLCMILDRDAGQGRWYRDPSKLLPSEAVTRFPHAILEVKLQVTDESAIPTWINELIESPLAHEVHKFSKFIHGCATLLTEDVQAVPYWVDDVTVASSMIESGAGHVLNMGEGATEQYGHLLPFSQSVIPGKSRDARHEELQAARVQEAQKERAKWGSPSGRPAMHDEDVCDWDECCCFPSFLGVGPAGMKMAGQRVEPKLFFANERTFIHWLHMAVTMSSVSTAVLAFGTRENSTAQVYALVMLPVSLAFAGYALMTFLWRAGLIHDRVVDRWDDPKGPVFLAVGLVIALSFNFCYRYVSSHA